VPRLSLLKKLFMRQLLVKLVKGHVSIPDDLLAVQGAAGCTTIDICSLQQSKRASDCENYDTAKSSYKVLDRI
jgi:hypothetical protein